MSQHLNKRTKPKKNKKKAVIVVILVILALVAFLFFMFGFWTELGLIGLFGEGFFDFSRFSVPANGADDLEGIIAKYEPVFEELQAEAVERLEELYQTAANEYREESQAGTLDRFQLTNKYLQAGRLLESNVDSIFNMLLTSMEKELKNKNLPTNIVTEIKAAYEDTKQEKKEEIFDRLRDQLGGVL